MLTQQADKSPGRIRGQEVGTDIQHQLLALRLGTGRSKRHPLRAMVTEPARFPPSLSGVWGW